MIDGRSPGSRHFFAPLTFPLSQWPGKTLKKVLPFTVAGAATAEIPWVRSIFPCSLLFPFWRHPEGEPSIKFITYLNISASVLLNFLGWTGNSLNVPFGSSLTHWMSVWIPGKKRINSERSGTKRWQEEGKRAMGINAGKDKTRNDNAHFSPSIGLIFWIIGKKFGCFE